ncbi:hypothetical protein PUN28_008725 [Cardiocondyla obscurior]|uniref:NADH dehydrogenase subunit 1 n=1 Tax=Cardiocondyla obscurior TaxID=286306 RepID=A0AAW2G483_9HYME
MDLTFIHIMQLKSMNISTCGLIRFIEPFGISIKFLFPGFFPIVFVCAR